MKPHARVIQQGRGTHRPVPQAVSATGAEKRFATRRPRNTPALIAMEGQILGQQVPPIPCILKDTSSTGALIQLSPSNASRWSGSAGGLPDRFRLQIPSELMEVDCEIAWRSDERIGVRFVAPARILQRQKKPEKPSKDAKPALLKLLGR